MDAISLPQFPFLRRDDLTFGKTTPLTLVVTAQANAAVVINIRAVTREGITKHAHTTLSTGAANTSTIAITDVPILVSVKDDAGSFAQGDCFVTLSLAMNGEIVHELCAGYIYKQKGISWPVNNAVNSIPGRGRFKFNVSNDPAAGTGTINVTIPTGRESRLICGQIDIVNDGTAGNRRMSYNITDNLGNVYLYGEANEVSIASAETTYVFGEWGAIPFASVAGIVPIVIPTGIFIPAAGVFQLTYSNVKAGDDMGPFVYMTEEFIVP